jgi:acyl-CoA reductase-like NAD-dependent aldehyde dehydrogenase
MAATVKMLIGGQWREGAKTYEVRDPYRGEVIGIKASGIGREGPRYAIREMTDERLVVFNL